MSEGTAKPGAKPLSTPVPENGGDPGERLARIEGQIPYLATKEDVLATKVEIQRIEGQIQRIEGQIPYLATKEDVLATKVEIQKIKVWVLTSLVGGMGLAASIAIAIVRLIG